jgi:hypothetical protein
MAHFEKWGPSARNCLELESETIAEQELEIKASSAAIKFAEDPITIAMETNLDNHSHLLFTAMPTNGKRNTLTLRVVTQHLRHIINQAISKIDAAKQISFYNRASNHPFFRGSFGYVFEKNKIVWLSSSPSSSPENELMITHTQFTPASLSMGVKPEPEPELKTLHFQPVGWENVVVQ